MGYNSRFSTLPFVAVAVTWCIIFQETTCFLNSHLNNWNQLKIKGYKVNSNSIIYKPKCREARNIATKALGSEEEVAKLAKALEEARVNEQKETSSIKDASIQPNNRRNDAQRKKAYSNRRKKPRRPRPLRTVPDNQWKLDLEKIGESKKVTLKEFNAVVTKCAQNRDWDAVLQVLELMHQRGLSPQLSTYKAIVRAFSYSGWHNGPKSSDLIIQVTQAMTYAGIVPDAGFYTMSISTCAREGMPKQGVDLLNKALRSDIKPSEKWFEQLILSCCKARKVDEAIGLLRRMKENDLRPSIHAYNNVLQGLSSGQKPQLVMRLLNELLHPSPDMHTQPEPPLPNQRTFIYGITALGRGGKWEQALEVLYQMERSGVKSHRVAYNAALSACERAQQWRAAKSLLDEMNAKEGIMPDVISYNTVISSCAKAGKSRSAMQLLEKMRSVPGLSPDRISYNSAISACAQAGKWSEAHVLMEKARLDGIEPDVITYTSLINACSRSGKPKRAISFLNMMKTYGIRPDVVAYTAAIDACTKGSLWKEALDLVDEMRDAGIEPNERTYRSTITACGQGGRWERALDILDHMRARGFKSNIYAYNAAASACEKAGEWQRVLGILSGMEERGVQPDAFTYSTAISACGKAGQWKKAVELMGKMRGGGPRMQPNVVTYTAAIHACVQASQWGEAKKLWETLQAEGLQPDLICYNNLLSGARRSNDWQWGLQILADMLASNIKPDMIAISNLMEVLEKNSQEKEADAVFEEALKQGLIFGPATLDNTWEIDVSKLPVLVAKHAVCYKLHQLKSQFQSDQVQCTEQKDKPESLDSINDLVFITGTGKKLYSVSSTIPSTKQIQSPQIMSKSCISDLLKNEFNLQPSSPKSLPGCLVISKRSLQNWLSK